MKLSDGRSLSHQRVDRLSLMKNALSPKAKADIEGCTTLDDLPAFCELGVTQQWTGGGSTGTTVHLAFTLPLPLAPVSCYNSADA